MSINKT